MSRPNLLRAMWDSFRKSLGASKTRTVVGKDHMGNVYYEEASDKIRPTRGFLPGDVADWRDIPAEWHSWIRHQRRFPPSDEEMRLNIQRRSQAFEHAAKDKRHIDDSQVPNIQDSTMKQEGVGVQKEFPSYKEYEDIAGAEFDRADDPRAKKK